MTSSPWDSRTHSPLMGFLLKKGKNLDEKRAEVVCVMAAIVQADEMQRMGGNQPEAHKAGKTKGSGNKEEMLL